MALDLRQNIRLTQQLLMTPQLQQAIKLLQLSRVELETFVSQQMIENPVLEEIDPASPSNDMESLASAHAESQNSEKSSDQKVHEYDESIFATAFQKTKSTSSYDDDSYNYENFVCKSRTLEEHLSEQLPAVDLSLEEKKIAELIIGNLSDRGFFEGDFQLFCTQENLDFELAEGVLDTIQRFDPVGIGARSLQECLLIQLKEKKLCNGIVEVIVRDHLPKVESRNLPLLAKDLKISVLQVIENLKIIAELDPIPARQFGDLQNFFVVPDVYIFKIGDKWVVTLNEEGLPHLRINSHYNTLVGSLNRSKDREYLSEKVRSANWLIKSIFQRQKTILRVSECILEKQMGFFERGLAGLKPMVLKDIALELGLHESTISRVTTHKYVQTPRGIFELKYFFNSSISTSSGEDMASESVKVLIKNLIENENPKKPFSDQKLVEILEKQEIKMARRTVAKYREQLSIGPSNKRKTHF